MLVAALVFGSHAMHDSFAVIRWREAGIGSEMISVLWSESVAAEVIVFFVLGRPILDRIGPARAAALCATAGLLRWIVMAHSVWVPALALVQPLHGLTFALLHLACMRLLSHIVPPGLSATAVTLYGPEFRRSADARLWTAVRPIRINRILGDGRALRSGDAARIHPQEHVDARPKLIPMPFRLWSASLIRGDLVTGPARLSTYWRLATLPQQRQLRFRGADARHDAIEVDQSSAAASFTLTCGWYCLRR